MRDDSGANGKAVMVMSEASKVGRRRFLEAGAATGAALAAGPVVGQAEGANERINVGVIGCGGMGSAHIGTLLQLQEEGLIKIVGVCDLFDKRLQGAASRTQATAYKDYRKLLERKDLDAVVIAVPDHSHAPITIAAANAGKDVYCEKPMTYWKDLSLPRNVVAAIKRNNRVMQVGTNGLSDTKYDAVRDRIRAGALGTLIHAQASDTRNGPIGVYSPKTDDPAAVPGETLDWETWLGTAPRRAYQPGRFFAFRSFWDYSGGVCTDFFPHILTPLMYVMDLGFPKRVSATGGRYFWDDGREVPDIFILSIDFPKGPSITLLGGLANDTNWPMIIRGQQATLTFGGPGAFIDAKRAGGNQKKREAVPRKQGGSLANHWKDFLGAIKTRKKPRSNEVIGYHVMTALHMGVRSYLEGKVFEFDEKTETVRAL